MHLRPLPPLLLLTLLAGGCAGADRPSGWVYPLPRRSPHDGLAVVTRPGGEGLHIWLDPDTSTPGVCRPRWNPDAARLRGGNGPTPTSGGRAPREEFYRALGRGPLRWALRRSFAALCRERAPGRRFTWVEPPRSDADFRPEPLPLLEEAHLLSHPTAVRRAEKRLLGIPLAPEDLRDEELPRPPLGP